MPRFASIQLPMGVALVGIVWFFTQTEGCGTRYKMIESLSFSHDDSAIAVSKLNARDARTPSKCYKANVSRTVSLLDVSTGNSRGPIHQDFEAGNCGPAFVVWRMGRTSVLFNPANDHLAMSAFGGGHVTRNVGTAETTVLPFEYPIYNIAYSKSGRFLAASGRDHVSVLDTQNDTAVMQVEASGDGFLDASLMAFSNDDRQIYVAGMLGVDAWDIATSTHHSTVFKVTEHSIQAIATAPDDTLVVCTDDWIRRYELTGQVVATLSDSETCVCSVGGNGNRLAVSTPGEVTIYDLRSDSIAHSLPFRGATAVALSSTGDQLAVGDFRGRVTLIDTETGEHRWNSDPPGRYRFPWTVPAVFLFCWIYVAWRLSRPRMSVDSINTAQPEVSIAG